jgi:hypothetical protein
MRKADVSGSEEDGQGLALRLSPLRVWPMWHVLCATEVSVWSWNVQKIEAGKDVSGMVNHFWGG